MPEAGAVTASRAFVRFARIVDEINRRFGVVAEWLVLFAALASAGNALMRYLFSYSSNGYLEAQWYMFGAVVLLGAPYTFRMNEHVRVDVIYSALLAARTPVGRHFRHSRLPAAGDDLPHLADLGAVLGRLRAGRASSQYGGLIRWPIKLVLPVGFALLALQGLSETGEAHRGARRRPRAATRPTSGRSNDRRHPARRRSD